MRTLYFVFIVCLMIISGGCMRRPPNYARNQGRRQPAKETVHHKQSSKKQDNSLPARIQRLTNEVENAFSSGDISEEDFDKWVELYMEYALEYFTSMNHLTDAQCGKIEYNLGRIAGIVYNDTVLPLIDELQDIQMGLDAYEERSKNWEGAAESGFESAMNRRSR